MDDINKFLDELEDILDSSRAVPFTGKISVDKDVIYEIINEIRMRLPNELKQAKWVIEERNKILIDAQREADEIVKNAEERVVKLVDEHEVTKKAYEQATNIMENSKRAAKEMRIGATEYADEVLSLTENRIREAMDMLKQESIKTDDFFKHTIGIIYENRQELRGVNK